MTLTTNSLCGLIDSSGYPRDKACEDQLRILVAELERWKPDDDDAGINTWEAAWTGNRLYGLKPTIRDGVVVSYLTEQIVPHYSTSLDAIGEAEKRYGLHEPMSFKTERMKFAWKAAMMMTFRLCRNDPSVHDADHPFATAAQRCIALLWTDAELKELEKSNFP